MPARILCFFFVTALVLVSQENTKREESTITKIKIGYMSNLFSQVDQKDAEAALEVWARKIIEENNLNYEATGIVFNDLVSVEQAISHDEVDLVSLNAMDYLFVRNNSHIEPAFVASRGDSILEELILLVHHDSGFNEIQNLESKSVKVLSGIYGQLPVLWLDTVLMKQGLPECGEFFKKIDSVEKSSSAILSVFFGQSDACIVSRDSFSTAVELNPQLGRDLRELISSPGLTISIACFRNNLADEHKGIIRDYIDKVSDDPAGIQILILFNTKKLVFFNPELLKSAESLVDEYHHLKSMQKGTNGK
jgi:phosphonate transport system substrate-binding protein